MRHLVAILAATVVVAVGAAPAQGAVRWGLAVTTWNFPHPPGSPLFAASGYHATEIRTVVPYCGADCVPAKAIIAGNLAAMAPLGLGQGNLYVVLTCHDTDPCGHRGDTEAYLRSSLKRLMTAYPGIRVWSPQNEPEDAAVVTNASGGGPSLAARLWIDAEAMAAHPARYGIPAGETIVAGEFGMVNGSAGNGGGSGPGWYPYQYAQALHAGLGATPAPSVWALHPYYDVQCASTTVTSDFLSHIDAVMGAATVRHVWLTELGVRLDHWPQCANTSALPAARSGAPAGIAATRQAQIASARTFLTLPSVDPRIDGLFYYTPEVANLHCWSGGRWTAACSPPPMDRRVRPTTC